MGQGPSRFPPFDLPDAESLSWRSVLFDLVVVVAWVGATSVLFRAAGWSEWLYYVVVFGGVIGYSLAIDPWRSPEH